MQLPRSKHLAIATLILAIAGIGWSLFIWWRPSPQQADPCPVFVTDDLGSPMHVVLLGPRLQDPIHTDHRGIAWVPGAWLGHTISVRKPADWSEIMVVPLEHRPKSPVRIVIRS